MLPPNINHFLQFSDIYKSIYSAELSGHLLDFTFLLNSDDRPSGEANSKVLIERKQIRKPRHCLKGPFTQILIKQPGTKVNSFVMVSSRQLNFLICV